MRRLTLRFNYWSSAAEQFTRHYTEQADPRLMFVQVGSTTIIDTNRPEDIVDHLISMGAFDPTLDLYVISDEGCAPA